MGLTILLTQYFNTDNMIDLILKMLDLDEMIGVSKEVDIAKGVNKLPLTFKEGFAQYKRKNKWQQS